MLPVTYAIKPVTESGDGKVVMAVVFSGGIVVVVAGGKVVVPPLGFPIPPPPPPPQSLLYLEVGAELQLPLEHPYGQDSDVQLPLLQVSLFEL